MVCSRRNAPPIGIPVSLLRGGPLLPGNGVNGDSHYPDLADCFVIACKASENSLWLAFVLTSEKLEGSSLPGEIRDHACLSFQDQ